MKIYTNNLISLIKIFFFSFVFLNLINKNLLCMREYLRQVDTPEKACFYIFKTYTDELLSCIKKRLDVDPSEFLENFIADLLHARKTFSDGRSTISNQLIADMLFYSNSLDILKITHDYWDSAIEKISRHFLPPNDDGDVIEILTILKYKQLILKTQ